ncbi:hypothetical protein BGX20_000384, partial [Mortierella sp. AD010]
MLRLATSASTSKLHRIGLASHPFANTLAFTSTSAQRASLFPTLTSLRLTAGSKMSFSKSPVPPKSFGTPIPSPLPFPRYPSKFTSSLPCDELSSIGHEDGEDAVPIPDSVLNTPRLVRDAVYSYVNPEDQSEGAFLLSWNKQLAETIGVDKNKLEKAQWTDEEYDRLVKVLTGGARKLPLEEYTTGEKGPRLAQPWALCYGGHQFGYYAGQLGDGRAISL